ncbi:anthranilate synthase component II [Blochmannia endosymbiont of Polyrhachis (Hedomyrma) turneri]|uniref:anthranilate synthase component II n=1 Tax=Blochmannia endosymbiont of Polyrhachis (Hedomyrma) turneri TaxID=1505596 RepID=UPI00061A88D6|nr:aminodeoxychorismate/anthranilate synthase component II [Blochmannia endosymbiont of Polyrhachis (Hedomyrma) turneri]AKC60126.1 para-aminobenzoate synthase glutamine amidotransferase component II [Blochmannia endosymbiont of Polyrhachis (Hedomyrma) turneri]
MNRKILIIDNYDSFTWNLYQCFCYLGAEVEVRRHDVINVLDIERLSPNRLVISPGPGTPHNSGISLSAIYSFYNKIPILGVCLGHQVIAHFFGAKIVHARCIMHGKSSVIHHDRTGVFYRLPQFLKVIRYNSLIVDISTLPSCLRVSAWSVKCNKFDEIMGIRHCDLPIEGVQFHPESVLSEYGCQLLRNFMRL